MLSVFSNDSSFSVKIFKFVFFEFPTENSLFYLEEAVGNNQRIRQVYGQNNNSYSFFLQDPDKVHHLSAQIEIGI